MKKTIYIAFFIILAVVAVILMFVKKSDTKTDIPPLAGTTPTVPISMDPLSLTYTIDNDPVTLVNGSSEVTLPDSISTETTEVFGTPTKGDINGDGKVDTVMVVAQFGAGTGQFFFLTAALMTEEAPSTKYKGLDSVFIGDRIAIQNISVEKSGRIVVNYADRAPGEPFTTEPSVGKTLYVTYKSDKDVEGGVNIGGLVVSK